MPSTVSVLLSTPGRERPVLRRALEHTLREAGVGAGDEVVVGNPGPDAGVSAAAAWAAAAGFSAALVREVALPAAIGEAAQRDALAGAAAGDLLVHLDDADLFYGNGVEVLRRASDEVGGALVLAFRQARGGSKDRMAAARRGRQGSWLAIAGYVQDCVARAGGPVRTIQAVAYMVRPYPDRW